ncbi:MAG TPA: hypothetical protein PKD64_06200 [Pirellulaceae bacterium]|nr:hypothetical protein [Pirellulaceae bacterium]HMO91772.1 hypothetical protein [Pirellulaceae bacterium]HMP69571.1 hypothetical protein [Pirellulaceae bacterium]
MNEPIIETTSPAENARSQVENARELSSLRWYIFVLLISCSLLTMVARLMTVEGESYGRSVPYFSANDRSRWVTIRALGDHNTFALDGVLQAENGRNWDSIDKVMHLGRDGQPHFYSSKPPMLSWLLAYQYVALKQLTGRNLTEDTFFIVRCMLLLSQVIPITIFFCLMASLADKLAKSEWTKLVVVATATYGTFLTTFAITLTNHVFAAVAAGFAIWSIVMIWNQKRLGLGYFFVTGLCASFAAACDLPATALLALCLVICLLKSPMKTLVGFVPPVLLVTAAFFASNYIAHQTWTPAYSHRNDGPVIFEIEGEFAEALDQGEIPLEIKKAIANNAHALRANLHEDVLVTKGKWPIGPDMQRWLVENRDLTARVVIGKHKSSPTYTLHRWSNWYEYPGSYWTTDNANKAWVDQGTPSTSEYAIHFLIGHHGVFSLSPIWIWALPGMFFMALSKQYRLRLLGWGILLITVVVIGFYLTRPELERAYGGMTSGPRWLFWLIPLWLVAMIPCLDRISTWGGMKVVTVIALFISAAAAAYSWSNPWVHPWIYTFIF